MDGDVILSVGPLWHGFRHLVGSLHLSQELLLMKATLISITLWHFLKWWDERPGRFCFLLFGSTEICFILFGFVCFYLCVCVICLGQLSVFCFDVFIFYGLCIALCNNSIIKKKKKSVFCILWHLFLSLSVTLLLIMFKSLRYLL